MRKVKLAIDSSLLEPWKEVAHVLGISMEKFIERLLAYTGKLHNERSCCLDELSQETTYTTRAEAEAVAERLEEWGAGEHL